MYRIIARKRAFSKRMLGAFLAVVIAVGMFGANIGGLFSLKLASAADVSLVLNASDMEIGKHLTDFTAGDSNFFTVLSPQDGVKTIDIDANGKEFDGFSFTKRLKLGGTGSKTMRAVKFTVQGAGSLVVHATTGSTGTTRPLILSSDADGVADASEDVGDTLKKVTYTLPAAGAYYLYSGNSGMNIYRMEVTVGEFVVVRKPWQEVAAPILGVPTATGTNITVPFTMEIGDNGADTVIVDMFKGETLLQTKKADIPGIASVTFAVASSGDYSFSIRAERKDEEDKVSETKATLSGYVLPLTAPALRGRTGSSAKGIIMVGEVAEATSYNVSFKKSTDAAWESFDEFTPAAGMTGDYSFTTPSALEVGAIYDIKANAKRGAESSPESVATFTIKDSEEFDWQFVNYGPSASSTSKNKVSGDLTSGLTLESTGNGGKLQDSADGGAFYYVPVSREQNFVLSATIKVEKWVYTNGQEGFLMYARDARPLPDMSNVDQYSNSFGFLASKIEYTYDTDAREESPMGDSKISMRIGMGSRNVSGITSASDSSKNKIEVTTKTLETTHGLDGVGNYNLFKNGTNAFTPGTIDTVNVTLKKTNTGFYISYTNDKGEKTEHIMYDWENLFVIDDDNAYIGFMASRNMTIKITDLALSLTDAKTDPPAEERPVEYLHPEYRITSSSTCGVSQYNLRFLGNADGKLEIKKDSTLVESNIDIKANVEYLKGLTLAQGINNYVVTFTPNKDYKPSEFVELKDYNPVTIMHSVYFNSYGTGANKVHISPIGNAENNGSIEKPLDIATAFKYAQPGQTFVLKTGNYMLTSALTIPRGIDGTAEKKITVIGEEGQPRPVLNFSNSSAGIVHWGNYWVFRGFDVTNTKDMQKGIQISGSYNTLIEVNTYNNGNTGIQISGISTETYEKWPAFNDIINCTSYNNADKGYEDADGFAAKLTTGPGNVFDGCIAYNNADDGWDLFAKIVTGPIGAVTIRNSIAYSNGFLTDGTVAGNGNGFKLGGSSIVPLGEDGLPGQHILENSITYNNKAKGIDSNSCPSLKVTNCTTFNNGSYNVALYTNGSNPTNFTASGIISLKDSNAIGGSTIAESIKPQAPQTDGSIRTDKNYFFNGSVSANSLNEKVTTDMFVSLDTTKVPTRYTDGGINMNGLLQLKEETTIKAGAAIIEGSCASPLTPITGTVIDGIDPVVKIGADSPTTGTVGSKITIKLDYSDNSTALADLKVEIKATCGTTNIDADSSFSFTPTVSGKHEITIKVTDSDGNFTIIYGNIEVVEDPRGETGCGCGSIGMVEIIPIALLLGGIALFIMLRKKEKKN